MGRVDLPTTTHNSGASSPAALESHLPSLDGMRAISILLVLGFHSYVGWTGADPAYAVYLGRLGVFIFFVISGLLITWLMIRERDATGAFSLRNFYIRRFLRILPVFWLLILTVSVLRDAHTITIEWLDIVRALTFTHNYPISFAHPRYYAWWLSHTWSLSLEEQFYLVWPSLFALLPRRVALRLAVTLTLAGPILRAAEYFLFPSLRGFETNAFEAHIDILMAGCASAFLLDSSLWRKRIRRIPVWPALASTSTFLLIVDPVLVHHFPAHSVLVALANLVLPTLEALAIALTLLVVVAGKPGLTYRALNARVPVHVGKLSYSLYIWQQLFLAPNDATGFFILACRLIAVYLVAFLSFNFFERPFLRLRGRFRHGVTV
jgi:peptidoglycan/LPS O-acetylase OafA/YrhL